MKTRQKLKNVISELCPWDFFLHGKVHLSPFVLLCFIQALDHFWLHLLKLFNSCWRAGGKIESHLSPDAQTGPLALCPSWMCTWRGGRGARRLEQGGISQSPLHGLTVRWSPGRWHTSHDSPTPNTAQAKWGKTTPSRLPISELAILTIKALPCDVRCV